MHGSGSGNFAQGMALRHRDRNHMALELRFKRLVMSAKKVKRDGSNNALFLLRRSEEVLDFVSFIPEYFIFFGVTRDDIIFKILVSSCLLLVDRKSTRLNSSH